MKNVNGFSPCQLVFSRNPNFPNVCDNKLPALECSTSSDVVASNLNAMHSVRKQFIQCEASEKLLRALRHQIRTYSDVQYNVNDDVYFRRNKDGKWQGPAKVIGVDGKQVLMKQESGYVCVHACRLTPANGGHYIDDTVDKQNEDVREAGDESTSSNKTSMDGCSQCK